MQTDNHSGKSAKGTTLILLLVFLAVFFPAALWAGLDYDAICAILMGILAVHLALCLILPKGGAK